ncbi:plastid acyl-ACP desaturase [Dunaliella salina]|uniref:Plastid acyl-ACP desaturase n=1 Tax=Dunaliella salina TaxID=3046 RepID=A0ABQ7GWH2_DUNSA|nr:plastid acyl-ACP desaturase [Dunaliella salina]|eukprot:KAF5838958.1 plastid acyl-ACP desaturase [Dunaliella salina]
MLGLQQKVVGAAGNGKQARCVKAAAGAEGRGVNSPLVTRAAATELPPRLKKPAPIILNNQVLHSITDERLDVVYSIADHVEKNVLPILTPVHKCWQPSELLPESSDPDFLDKVQDLRKRASSLPDDYLVVFTGDMITEEALPTYMTMLNTLDGVRDETGASMTPWGRWTRAWTAEENRHGDVMNKYMYLTGRVNMKAVEVTTQNLIGSGMDPKTENNPYLGFTYTSFQERATKTETATPNHTLANSRRCENLPMHLQTETATPNHTLANSRRIMDALFERDPNGAVQAFADMMKKQIVMPAHLMNDNEHDKKGRNLFADFSAVAERTKTYTAFDYADIMEHLVERWRVANLQGLRGEAAEAQEYLMKMPNRVRKLAERAYARRKANQHTDFSWVFNREVQLS